MGRVRRDTSVSRGGDSPAPGAYDATGGMGAQSLSGRHSAAAFSIGRARKGEQAGSDSQYKFYDAASSFGKQGASSRPSSAAAAMHGGTIGEARSPTRLDNATRETFSDMTRFGNKPVAQQSEGWARQVGRMSSSSRDIDFVHRY